MRVFACMLLWFHTRKENNSGAKLNGNRSRLDPLVAYRRINNGILTRKRTIHFYNYIEEWHKSLKGGSLTGLSVCAILLHFAVVVVQREQTNATRKVHHQVFSIFFFFFKQKTNCCFSIIISILL